MALPVAPVFDKVMNHSKARKSVSSNNIQWPEFKVTQPDPVLGEIFSGKGSLTPEQTLVEFISTSAAFHGVKKQPLRTLEWDLLKVLPFNVMPANAAAWYMAKRKFYMNQSFDQQLLPYLLKKYPEKFKVIGTQVIFLEVYTQEVAKMKLKYLVQYGLNAYFSHKSDEYGVYFFDPLYYENTEPFHESLRQCSSRPNMQNRSKLVSSYFNCSGMKDQFKYQQHSAYLVSICKQPGVKIVTNMTGIIISMINNQYGFIKFGSGETALFCCKSLFKDGWQFTGDPLKLPAMKFDGYQIQGGGVRGDQAYSWYAVLVWCGRRPSPKFCSTAEDLNSTPVFREGRLQRMSVGGSPIIGEGSKKLRQPSSSMMVGKVSEIRRNGAVLKVRDDSMDKVFVPGWKRQLANSSGIWLSTMSGECIGLGDMVAYYVDTEDIRPGYTAVGKNVMVLKECEELLEKGDRQGRRRKSTERSAGADYDVGEMSGEDVIKRLEGSDDDSGPEEDISDGELDWLEIDIGTMIAKEDPQAKTLKLLTDVQTQLKSVRRRGTKFSKGGNKATFRSGYTPMTNNANSFWRMKKMLSSVEAGYSSGSDPDYEPGDDVEIISKPRDESETVESSFTSEGDGSVGVDEFTRKKLISTVSSATVGMRSDRVRAESGGKLLPFWVRAVSAPEKFDAEMEKFVPIDKIYSEVRDPDYDWPETDIELEASDEDSDGDLDILIKEANEELPIDIKEGKYRATGKIVSPVKVVLTPSKEGDEEPEDEILTLESEDESLVKEKNPNLWEKELLLTEQPEDYDSDDDPEFVPLAVIYDTDLDYDEYSDGADEITEDEVKQLTGDQEVFPPQSYIPIWVPISSPAEKIERAKEHLKASGIKAVLNKDETSVKDTDSNSNGKNIDEASVFNSANEKLQDGATGLSPGMKKVKADSVRTSSEDGNADVPKQKRERKKSKSKAKCVDGVIGEDKATLKEAGDCNIGQDRDAEKSMTAKGDVPKEQRDRKISESKCMDGVVDGESLKVGNGDEIDVGVALGEGIVQASGDIAGKAVASSESVGDK